MVHFKSLLQIQNIGLIFIGSLLIMNNIAGIEFNRYIYLVLFGALFMLGNKGSIYECIAFMVPCLTGLPYNHILITAFVVLLIKNGSHKNSYTNTGVFCIIAIIVLEILSMSSGIGEFNVMLSFISIFSLTFMRLIDTDFERYNSQKICLYFIVGYWVAMLCLFGQYGVNGYSILSISNMAEDGFRIGDTNEFTSAVDGIWTNISYDNNGLGEISIMAALASLLLWRRRASPLLLISAFGALSVGMATLSRAFVLTAILSLMAFFIFGYQRRNIVRNTILTAIVICTIFYLLSTVLTSFVVGFESRMNTDDISNGRVDIFAMYNNILINDPLKLLFGVGIQKYSTKLGVIMSSHNGTQEVVLAWGLFGLVLIITMLIVALKNAKRYFSISKQYYIPLFALIIFSQTGQSFSQPLFVLLLFLAFDMLLIENEYKSKSEI